MCINRTLSKLLQVKTINSPSKYNVGGRWRALAVTRERWLTGKSLFYSSIVLLDWCNMIPFFVDNPAGIWDWYLSPAPCTRSLVFVRACDSTRLWQLYFIYFFPKKSPVSLSQLIKVYRAYRCSASYFSNRMKSTNEYRENYAICQYTQRTVRLLFAVFKLIGETSGSRCGPGTDILLDGVRCDGSEKLIGDCSHRGWGRHSCDHRRDVSIRHSNTSSVAPWNGDDTTVQRLAEHILFISWKTYAQCLS